MGKHRNKDAALILSKINYNAMATALAKVGNVNQAIINPKKTTFTDMLFLYLYFNRGIVFQ